MPVCVYLSPLSLDLELERLHDESAVPSLAYLTVSTEFRHQDVPDVVARNNRPGSHGQDGCLNAQTGLRVEQGGSVPVLSVSVYERLTRRKRLAWNELVVVWSGAARQREELAERRDACWGQ